MKVSNVCYCKFLFLVFLYIMQIINLFQYIFFIFNVLYAFDSRITSIGYIVHTTII